MPEENPAGYDFAEEMGSLADMNDGQFHNTSLAAGEVGEVAEVELGDTGQGVFSEYERFALGGIPDDQLRTRQARVEGDLQDGADADVADSVRIRLRIRKKRGGETIAETRWYKKTEIEASNTENLPLLIFQGVDEETWAQEGRVLVVEARDPSASVTIHRGNSTLEFPFVGAF